MVTVFLIGGTHDGEAFDLHDKTLDAIRISVPESEQSGPLTECYLYSIRQAVLLGRVVYVATEGLDKPITLEDLVRVLFKPEAAVAWHAGARAPEHARPWQDPTRGRS